MESTFELLKWRLLLKRLDRIESAELHALVIRELHVAAVMARSTAFPWLVFPCLFEERVDAALARQATQASHYWRDFSPPAHSSAIGRTGLSSLDAVPGYDLAAAAFSRSKPDSTPPLRP